MLHLRVKKSYSVLGGWLVYWTEQCKVMRKMIWYNLRSSCCIDRYQLKQATCSTLRESCLKKCAKQFVFIIHPHNANKNYNICVEYIRIESAHRKRHNWGTASRCTGKGGSNGQNLNQHVQQIKTTIPMFTFVPSIQLSNKYKPSRFRNVFMDSGIVPTKIKHSHHLLEKNRKNNVELI